ncbi:DUF6790 family protein [Roseixanthobacter pseudopolyaromaticivorans]|uniref:DUF6790 family protein n=1 Tax=Xanthobacteraceae TaxID=335928 RepID=UPI0037264311
MIQSTIEFVLRNIPEILFVAAFVLAAVTRTPAYFPARLLGWLLLSAGLAYAWAGVFHILFPRIAAASIGWAVSPFQFEIGVADTAIGLVAIVSFWRTLDFKGPVVGYLSLFSIGVAYGHIRDAIYAGNTAADNFGALLIITLVHAVLLPVLYLLARRNSA